jgi:colicin import membrane protein
MDGMDFDSKINQQSNFFTILIHLSLILFIIISFQWSPKNPYFSEVELWDAVPTVTKKSAAPPKPQSIKKETVVKKVETQTPKNTSKEAEINLKKKKQKALEDKKKKEEQIKKVKEDLLKQEQIKQLQNQLLEAEKIEKLQNELLEQELKTAEQEIITEDKKQTKRIALEGDKDLEAGRNNGELDKYKALIQQKIQQNVNNNLCGLDFLSLSFEISLLPSGELLSDPLLKESSKNPSCDEAVERAIFQSEPLPVPTDPKLFAKLKKLKLKFYPNGQPQ